MSHIKASIPTRRHLSEASRHNDCTFVLIWIRLLIFQSHILEGVSFFLVYLIGQKLKSGEVECYAEGCRAVRTACDCWGTGMLCRVELVRSLKAAQGGTSRSLLVGHGPLSPC